MSLKAIPTDVLRYILNEFHVMEFTKEHDKAPIKSLFGHFEHDRSPFLVFPHAFLQDPKISTFKRTSTKTHSTFEFCPRALRSLEMVSKASFQTHTTLLSYCKHMPNLVSLIKISFYGKLRSQTLKFKKSSLKTQLTQEDHSSVSVVYPCLKVLKLDFGSIHFPLFKVFPNLKIYDGIETHIDKNMISELTTCTSLEEISFTMDISTFIQVLQFPKIKNIATRLKIGAKDLSKVSTFLENTKCKDIRLGRADFKVATVILKNPNVSKLSFLSVEGNRSAQYLKFYLEMLKFGKFYRDQRIKYIPNEYLRIRENQIFLDIVTSPDAKFHTVEIDNEIDDVICQKLPKIQTLIVSGEYGLDKGCLMWNFPFENIIFRHSTVPDTTFSSELKRIKLIDTRILDSTVKSLWDQGVAVDFYDLNSKDLLLQTIGNLKVYITVTNQKDLDNYSESEGDEYSYDDEDEDADDYDEDEDEDEDEDDFPDDFPDDYGQEDSEADN